MMIDIDGKTNQLIWKWWAIGTVTDEQSYEWELHRDILINFQLNLSNIEFSHMRKPGVVLVFRKLIYLLNYKNYTVCKIKNPEILRIFYKFIQTK